MGGADSTGISATTRIASPRGQILACSNALARNGWLALPLANLSGNNPAVCRRQARLRRTVHSETTADPAFAANTGGRIRAALSSLRSRPVPEWLHGAQWVFAGYVA